MEVVNDFWIYNGEYQPFSQNCLTELFGDDYAYEVIRLINGTPFFLKEHYNRLVNTCAKSQNDITLSLELLKSEITLLSNNEKYLNINIKVLIKGEHRAVFAIPSFYPSTSEYKKGIDCELLFEERENPELKIFQADIREKADKIKQQQAIYESLLVGVNGCITEGSKSNFFLIEGDMLYTAPSATVLSGITRQKIIEIAHENNIPLVYKSVNYKDLAQYDAAFICGTSPGIIAIHRIRKVIFRVNHPLLVKLQYAYTNLL